MMRCRSCGTVFTSSLPSTQAEAEDYSAYYHERNLEVPVFLRQRLDELVHGLEPFRRGGRWLDVGCGAGALLHAASRGGWQVVGTEVAPAAAEAVRAEGFDVRLGELDSVGLEPASFDVISAVEVIEHVADPGGLIQETAGLLRPGGALYITTPHGKGMSARLLRTDWSVMSPPEHLQLFSIRGLKTVLSAAGLEVLRVRTHAVNPRELLTSLRRDGDVGGGERVASGYRLNEALSTGRAGRAAKAAVNGTLNVMRLGDALKVTASKPGWPPALP